MLQNVFSFDSYNDDVSKTIYEVFHRYGIFVGKTSERHGKVELAPIMDLPDMEILGTLWLPDSMLNESHVRFESKEVKVERGMNGGMQWMKLQEKVLARGAVFSEELFHFFHRTSNNGTSFACASSKSYTHILNSNPLELVSYLVSPVIFYLFIDRALV